MTDFVQFAELHMMSMTLIYNFAIIIAKKSYRSRPLSEILL
jgi:hypothetical protein